MDTIYILWEYDKASNCHPFIVSIHATYDGAHDVLSSKFQPDVENIWYIEPEDLEK